MAWLVATEAEFQLWPTRHVTFGNITEKVKSYEEFGLPHVPHYTCSIVEGRSIHDQYEVEWSTIIDRPEEYYGYIMINGRGSGVHVTLALPEEAYATFYTDLLMLQNFEIDIEFGVGELISSYAGSKALVDGEFRLLARRKLSQ